MFCLLITVLQTGQTVTSLVIAWTVSEDSILMEVDHKPSLWRPNMAGQQIISPLCEDTTSLAWTPFDSNIACLCQSIEINNNKYVYRQSQVRKPIGNKVEWAECLLIIGTGCRVQDRGAKWAECSLIIGTGCRVQVFSLILDSSVGLSASIQSAGE